MLRTYSGKIGKFTFGKTQLLTSYRMQKYPLLAKLVYQLLGYTNVGNYARSKVVIRLLRKLPLQSFEEIVDLGCGYGEYSFMIADALPQSKITALEIDPERLGRVRHTKQILNISNVNIHDGKIETLPKDQQVDFIFSVDVFEHIYEAEMPFKACCDQLKEGGYLLVKMPNISQKTIFPDSLFQEHQQWLDDEHIGQIYNLEGLKKRFTDEGFSIVHASYSDGFWSRLAWELSYFAKKGGAIAQLLFLPIAKLLINVDLLFDNSKSGNAVQVIGQK